MSAIPVSVDASTQVVPVGSSTTLYGWSLGETAAAVASVLFHNGDATGPVVAVGNLLADGDSTVIVGDGILCDNGLYVEVVAGAVAGAVYYK